MNKRLAFPMLMLCAAATQNSHAAINDLRWSGFINATASASNAPEKYLDRIDNNGEFSDSGLGLNLYYPIDRSLSIQGQLFGHDANDGVVFDWYFLTYRTDAGNKLKVGKIKNPSTLISEYVDVGLSYPWIRPPQEMYGHNEAGIAAALESFKGVSYTLSRFVSDDEVELEAIVFGGESERDEEDDPSYNKLFGVKVGAKSDNGEVYLSYSTGEMEEGGGHGDEEGEEEEEGFEANEKDNEVIATGVRYDNGSFLTYLEYSMVEVEDAEDMDTDIWYVTVGYHFGKYTPHLTVASFEQDTGLEHESITLGLRYDITPKMAVKFEYQDIEPEGEAGEEGVFFEELPDGNVDLYSVSLNLVF